MKTKFLRLTLCSILLVTFFGFQAVPNTSAQTAQISPEEVIKAFYNWYTRPGSSKEGKATLRKYVTASAISRAEKFGSKMEADYFVQSQEWDDDWENNFTVSKPVIKGAIATTFVTFPTGYPRVKVTLKKEAGAWKIDGVQEARR